MSHKHQRTPGDKVMIAVLSLAVFLGLAFGVFALVTIATHTFDGKTGIKALAGLAIFSLICYRALRKRMDGLAR